MALPRAKIGRPRKVKTIIRGQAIVRYNERYRLEAIVRYNRPKKTFSRDCTIQSAEKNFFMRLYDTIDHRNMQ